VSGKAREGGAGGAGEEDGGGTGARALDAAVGLAVHGVVPLGPRAFALAFEHRGRLALWVLLEARDARCALGEGWPGPPDPRESRFELPERSLRGARLRAIEIDASRLVLRFDPRPGAAVEYALVVTAAERPVNLHLREGDRDAWSLRPAREGAKAPLRPGRVIVEGGTGDREGLAERIRAAFREDFDRMLARALREAEARLARRAGAAERDLIRARERRGDRRRAEILLAHFGAVPRGASRVGLPDPYADSPGAEVQIPLDPSLSPQENAARLFQSAKRGERGEQVAEERLALCRKNLAGLAQARRVIASVPPKEALASLDTFLREAGIRVSSARGDGRNTRLGQDRAATAPRAERPGRRPPGAHKSIGPRTFRTSDGWEVWVGRNNLDNDRITHRLSNPHDFWFHAHGYPGSHVILRRPSRQATPQRSTLIEAAELAAWFSQARKLTRVPVIYTERKFVSKPRRAKPGLAVCTREREILVRPRKPGSTAGTRDDD
jgi:hypothetical protein